MKPLLSLVIGFLFCMSAMARDMAPIAPPVLGPIERPARPLLLVFDPIRVTVYNPMREGLVGMTMTHITDSRFAAAAKKLSEAIQAATPNFDVTGEIRAGFRCGESGSLCTEVLVLPPLERGQTRDEALIELMQERQWTNASLLSMWWEDEKRTLLARASLTEMELKGEELETKHPVPVMYAITEPAAAGDVPHAEDWEFGAPIPREAALRQAIHALEPMLQMSLSWGVNNDPISKERVAVHARDQIRRYRPQGLECRTLEQCNAGFDSATDERVWVWKFIDTARNIKSYIMELQSRPRVDP